MAFGDIFNILQALINQVKYGYADVHKNLFYLETMFQLHHKKTYELRS